MKSEVYRSLKGTTPDWSNTTVTENTPDGFYSITEITTAEGVKRSENITIGNRRFSKTDNEPWKELPQTEGIGGGAGRGNVLTADPINSQQSVKYKYKGKMTINGQNTDWYETKTTIKFKVGNTEITSVVTDRFWLNQEGLFLKTESLSENKGRIISHSIREYEYDPKIKIEAPIKP
jgi:hypothetical protein